MSGQNLYLRMAYILSYIIAVSAAFFSYKSFYAFKSLAPFGNQIIVLNFSILLFLWFLSFSHTEFIRKNFFMVLILPLIGLHATNFLLMLISPGTSFLGYIGFMVFSSFLIFFSYRARIYEKRLQSLK